MERSTENRPKIIVPLTKSDYCFEIATAIALIICWLLPVLLFPNLPDTIPTHYGLNGRPDDWGSKVSIFLLPAITTILYLGLTVLNRFPHVFNYTVKITSDNAKQQYYRSTRIIRILKLTVIVLFLFIEWQVCRVSLSNTLPVWLIPGIIIVPIVLPFEMAFLVTNKHPDVKK